MARPSLESLSIAAVSIPVRPDPPEDMDVYAQKVWREVVSTKPPEWFESDSFPLLRAYCQASEQHKKLADKLRNCEVGSDNYKSYLIMMTKQAEIIGQLGVKMRLTQQSRYTPKAASTANKRGSKSTSRLWD